MNELVSVANAIAKVIAYNADEPVSGDVIEVTIQGKKVLVHTDFKYAMDVYYDFYEKYHESVKKSDIVTLSKLITDHKCREVFCIGKR